MITKDQLVESMLRECEIVQHLYTKLTPASYDYRPSPEQRSTLELLRYLSMCGIAGTRCVTEQNWGLWSEWVTRAKEMPANEFPAAMARQAEELRAYFDALPADGLSARQGKMPFGTMLPLGVALLDGPLKWLTAYKMQLFLYAKATGATSLGTSNAWRGVDSVPK